MSYKQKGFTRRNFVKQAASGLGIAGFISHINPDKGLNTLKAPSLKPQGTDFEGSPVSVVAMDAGLAYSDVPLLLQQVINENDRSAWKTICEKIDYIYEAINPLMENIESECGCISEALERVESGKTLFFKVNTVVPAGIDPATHGEGASNTSCTDWTVAAALLRWFHDTCGISYHHMAVGEGGALQTQLAVLYSKMLKNEQKITEEAVLEGKSGDFYGGWGFYFARKYLAERHNQGHSDDPMKGYIESEKGIYIPPGKRDGLYVYALNLIDADEIRGREIPVPSGENYQTVFFHKAIIGGDPDNPEDRKNYPGSVIVNVPKLKVHTLELLTNAIKNIGFGLFPTEAGWDNNPHNTDWRYGIPKRFPPSIKNVIHEDWLPEIDAETWITKLDGSEHYVVRKTGGLKATMVDANMAVLNLGIKVLHITDAIHVTNFSHDHNLPDSRRTEGMIMISPDPVALDLMCARYMFHQVPAGENSEAQHKLSTRSDFIQKVPLPVIKGDNIETTVGYDSPISRYNLFSYAEKRGLGSQKYYIVGTDIRDKTELVSRRGHLGKIVSGQFKEILTKTLYYDTQKFFWDMQKTSLAYLSANDKLIESRMKETFLRNLDDDNDGIVWFNNFGRRGMFTSWLSVVSEILYIACSKAFGNLKSPFIFSARLLKGWQPQYNVHGIAVFEDFINSAIVHQAYIMSLLSERRPDPVVHRMEYGKGRWPSFKCAEIAYITGQLYGPEFPYSLSLLSMYGLAFQYADKVWNNETWTAGITDQSNPAALKRYIEAVQNGTRPLDFTLYVANGFGKSDQINLPNIEETDDPAKVFTAAFNNQKEIWS